MKLASRTIFEMSSSREEQFFKDCIFVFDSSALLDFYLIPKDSQVEIFDKVFKKLENRLWMTSHSEHEYLKNRSKTIFKPIKEKYEPIENQNVAKITQLLNSVNNEVKSLHEMTSKDTHHPYLDQTDILEFKQKVESLLSDYVSFKDKLSKQIETKQEEIKNLKDSDIVLKALEDNFEISRKYSFDELMDIAQEGKFRYEFSIPPGYEDAKDKVGLQIFGDLFIWKQIIEIAKTQKKNVALICNDVKEDWCCKNGKRIDTPREELIMELYSKTSSELWMYTLDQFLYASGKYLEAQVEKEVIEEVRVVSESKDSVNLHEINIFSQEPKVLAYRLFNDLGFGTEKHVDDPKYFKESGFKMSSKDISKIDTSSITLVEFLNTIGEFYAKNIIAGVRGQWIEQYIYLKDKNGKGVPVDPLGNHARSEFQYFNILWECYKYLTEQEKLILLRSYRTDPNTIL